ncbi:Glucan endo-1,3-beta-glucosidase [Sesamum angolense]|uniref:Glucan endo-1,3-beta-glucosidase n=1 Tax=Sesamum angolense TaxID=2727404 RepID=A0AAE2C4F6_9LAMI|nr:Glucan endo-1,3-beta-glucosidase [Sesamum angolense]
MSKKSSSVAPLDYLIFLYLLVFFAAVSAVMCQPSNQGAGSIGVCNGRLGSDLPPEQEVVELYKTSGIRRMRIYDPNQATLTALQGSDIELVLDVPNVDLESLQSDATHWVQTNVVQYFPATRIRYIAVGNEVDPEKETSRFVRLVLPAMQNIHKALSELGLQDQIKVSTATYSALLMNTYPPSNAMFKDMAFMEPIISFLAQTRAPLLANIYPYFGYIYSQGIELPYALFTAPGVVVQDGPYGYQNLFDAMVDAMYSALEKAGGGDVEVVVSESGWPSDGGVAATMKNANTYYRNLIGHVNRGSPKRPGKAIETYLFAMFDENNKTGEKSEQHFGLFYPNKQPKYQLILNNEEHG